jgi:predicted nucleotidyltransferase
MPTISPRPESAGENGAVVCVMSGNWVQRGEAAIADKWTRLLIALRGGADLVLELPTVWAASTAEKFALGAAAMLNCLGLVEVLSFGSESGDLEQLRAAADCLLSEQYGAVLGGYLKTGISFAAARQRAVRACTGPAADCLSHPNDILAVEYLKALRTLDSPIIPAAVPRRGAGHDAAGAEGGYRSASALRELMLKERWAEAEPFLPEGGGALLRTGGLADLRFCERGVLARIKAMDRSEFEALPDSGEGLSNRLADAARRAGSLEELYALAKTKRYALSRLRRMVLWAFLGLSEADRPECPPYVRVLGLNQKGRAVLRDMRKTCALPVITKPGGSENSPGRRRPCSPRKDAAPTSITSAVRIWQKRRVGWNTAEARLLCRKSVHLLAGCTVARWQSSLIVQT